MDTQDLLKVEGARRDQKYATLATDEDFFEDEHQERLASTAEAGEIPACDYHDDDHGDGDGDDGFGTVGGNGSSGGNDDADDDQLSPSNAVHDNEGAASLIIQRTIRVLHTNLFPDDRFSICGIAIMDGTFAVKLLKFVIFTFGSIAITHAAVSRWVDDRDKSLELWQLIVFEGNSIIADTVIFFLVGRLHKQRGIDNLAWIGWVLLCNLYFECQQYFTWLQHSVTLYEMHCVWPWQLWLFVFTMVPLALIIIYLHIKRAYMRGIILLKLTEMAMCFFFFLLPLTTSTYFHMHHWYAGWLFGMHANFDVWWSRAVMAWAWGAYINGISVYGRDPVLTCQYAYFVSVDQSCPYMQCYIDAINQPKDLAESTPHPPVAPMIPPNWHNCSADSYHG